MAEAKEQVAIITGAGSGIGEETSYAFAKQGVLLTLVDMHEDRLIKVKGQCEKHGLSQDQMLTVTCDLANESSYDAVIDQTVAKFGRIDILVNNAGFFSNKGIEDMPPVEMDLMYKVMLKAPIYLTKKALPYLKKNKGNVINISSAAAYVANNALGYSVIKAAVDNLTRCTAIISAADGVRVNCICPAIVRTSLWAAAGFDLEKVMKDSQHNIPLGRVAEVTDIASAITFLTSDAASFITGTSILVDGGLSLASPVNFL